MQRGRLPAPSLMAVVSAVPLMLPPGWYQLVKPYAYSASTPWRAGQHRGVDVRVANGNVRAFAGGRVRFSGRVAGRLVVSVLVRGSSGKPRQVATFVGLERIDVVQGQRVAAGDRVGYAHGDVHLGLRDRGDRLSYTQLEVPGTTHRGRGRNALADELGARLEAAVRGVAAREAATTESMVVDSRWRPAWAFGVGEGAVARVGRDAVMRSRRGWMPPRLHGGANRHGVEAAGRARRARRFLTTHGRHVAALPHADAMHFVPVGRGVPAAGGGLLTERGGTGTRPGSIRHRDANLSTREGSLAAEVETDRGDAGKAERDGLAGAGRRSRGKEVDAHPGRSRGLNGLLVALLLAPVIAARPWRSRWHTIRRTPAQPPVSASWPPASAVPGDGLRVGSAGEGAARRRA